MDNKASEKQPIGRTQAHTTLDSEVCSTHNTQCVLHNKTHFTFSTNWVSFHVALLQTALPLLYKSPTLRKSIPKHYITLVKTSFASIQTSPVSFASQYYLRLSQISLPGLSIFLQSLLPSLALTDSTLPPLSFMLTPSYQHRAKEHKQNSQSPRCQRLTWAGKSSFLSR